MKYPTPKLIFFLFCPHNLFVLIYLRLGQIPGLATLTKPSVLETKALMDGSKAFSPFTNYINDYIQPFKTDFFVADIADVRDQRSK